MPALPVFHLHGVFLIVEIQILSWSSMEEENSGFSFSFLLNNPDVESLASLLSAMNTANPSDDHYSQQCHFPFRSLTSPYTVPDSSDSSKSKIASPEDERRRFLCLWMIPWRRTRHWTELEESSSLWWCQFCCRAFPGFWRLNPRNFF